MRWAIVAIVLLLCGLPISASARHGGVLIDARRATPGVHLELVEGQGGAPDGSLLYHLRVSGIPANVVFGIWTKEFGGAFQEVLRRFRLDGTGSLAGPDQAGNLQPIDKVSLVPGSYPRGAAWEVALVSEDGTVTAFARVIPQPISARAGTCTLSLELVSRHGDRFIASGDGFIPGEAVAIEWLESDRPVRRFVRAGVDGQLPPDVLSHRGTATDRRARYSVAGRQCALALDYDWGGAALTTRR